MRLLERHSDSEFSLTKNFSNHIPKYAILSHTWGADTEEVNFRDLIDGTGKSKDGYRKIRFCGEQANRDGLQYFWVDTCCIDKSNSTELAEAINSMFRWYHDAAKCYVYLSDVSTAKRKRNTSLSDCAWESAFRASRWFTRGWTLQELIAPSSVEFFSQEGKRLGDKKTLERQIHEITGIAVSAIHGAPLSLFGVDERLSWAENRQTTREEDKAYSLLGIFNVYMPLIYGERREHAFKRLQEEINGSLKGHNRLDRLPYAPDALFNSFNKQNAPICLPETRVDLLQEIYDWANGQDERCIFWLNGLAGTGKSTIARTVARKYFEEDRLGASFFFSRGDGDVGHAGKFFTSIAMQLANNIPSLRQYINDAITEDIASQSLRDQWCQLILRPLSRLDSSLFPSCHMLIVDALDECDKGDHIQVILQHLAEARTLKTVRLRIFLTSRPEIPIRHGFYQIPDKEHQDFVLHNISPSIVNHDISIFLRHSLKLIASKQSLGAGWPGEQIIQRLVYHSNGLFIWAATAYRFIRDGRRFATKRLNMVLESGSTVINAPEKHLNEIYLTVLRQSISADYTPKEAGELRCILNSLLGSIVTLFSPLSTRSLSKLLNISQEDIDQALDDLHAILDIPKDVSCPLHLHHPSFRDFLLNKERCGDPNFQVDEKQAHQTLTKCCIQLMSISLKRDICGQEAPGTLIANIKYSQIEQCLPPEVQYACLYWIQHLQKSDPQFYSNDYVYQFLEVHLLHWLEALGWIGKTSEGIRAILSLETQIKADQSPSLYTFVYDIKRFVLYNRWVIEHAPLQLYCSALVFAPEKSIVRKLFEQRIPAWIQTKLKVQADWSAAIQTLEGHSGWVHSVAFSPDGKQVLSGSEDGTVWLWDAATGVVLQTFEGHLSGVLSVAFSPDGEHVISGSDDGTVRLWDTSSGAALQTFEGYSDWVYSIAFSPDRKQVVFGSHDGTVWLWDTAMGAALLTLKGHSDGVLSVVFSPDSKYVVFGSHDKTVQLWDTVSGAVLQTFEGHSSGVFTLAFSPNSEQVVSGSGDGTVRLWDTVSGAALQTFVAYSNEEVYSVAFSPDGKHVVSGLADGTVQLWDTATGAALQTIEAHSAEVYSVAFSPDGKQIVSGSADKTVRLWDAASGAAPQTFEGHSSWVHSVAISPDGKQVVSGSGDKTVRLWDTVSGAALQTLKGHSSWVYSVAFSPNSGQIVSGSGDKTVRLWDIASGAVLQILEGHSDYVYAVAFSPNSEQVVSGSGDKTVRLWNTVSGAVLYTLEGHLGQVHSVAFSLDGKQVASGSENGTVWLWDTATGAALQTFNGYYGSARSVAFSLDGKLVISRSDRKEVRLWDTVTGAAVQTLEGYSGGVHLVAFSIDGNMTRNLFTSNNWVAEGGSNLLWLPPSFRATCEAVWKEVIVLGHAFGKISILRFKKEQDLYRSDIGYDI